jgi:hypothetical protein
MAAKVGGKIRVMSTGTPVGYTGGTESRSFVLRDRITRVELHEELSPQKDLFANFTEYQKARAI